MKKVHVIVKLYALLLFGFLVGLGYCANQGILLFGETPSSESKAGTRSGGRSHFGYYRHYHK